MRGSVAALLFCTACNLSTGSSEAPEWTQEYWKEAQHRLSVAGYPRADTIPPDWFTFIPHQPTHPDGDAYMLDGDWVYGHYSSRYKEIHYCIGVERVVIHEAGHAILAVLGQGGWQCWEHECWEE